MTTDMACVVVHNDNCDSTRLPVGAVCPGRLSCTATIVVNIMSIVASLIERLTAKPDNAPLLYAAEHVVVATDGAYRTLDIAAYPGLAMLHTVSCGAHVKVLSYWRSAEQ